ncbi:unnamed protein product [Spirodela intermedia]|uniref:DNA-directed RNA polymerase III subunit RPC3 n=2 Tax=Spirodela intermedia TaxID=51605 RepID=A0A7I8KXT6_SPIIN|nr:unnamed protein product [Spirodela intermedia]CAA6665735.1 unnamed protein product [Spirodela intermedia]CAA7402491.1 unnamed protein product [Spirodela intermedia]
MVGQQGLNLAVGIITSHFGDVVAKVCSCLLRRGSLSLQEIVRDIGLPPARVKNCLLVLVQHNCVQAYSVPRAVTQYMGLLDNILHRMRFPKFLGILAAEFDDPLCLALVEGLLQHGRLTFEQLVMRATSTKSERTMAIRDSLRGSLDQLIRAHYVERCPKPEPFISATSEDETSTARKRGSKLWTLEQKALAAAALLDAERFSGIGDINGDESNSNQLEEKAKGISASTNIGEKRKHEELEFDRETQAAINENEVLWRANFEKFIHCLKKKACVTSVRTRLSLDAAVVLEAMIESSNHKKAKENLVTSSLDEILEWVMKKPGGRLMTMQHVRTCLEELKCKSSTEDTKALYAIDLGEIVEECRSEEVGSLVLQRYGKDAYRMFRLLVKRCRPVETDNLAEITFVKKKEAPGILYKLWMDNYVHMEIAVAYPGEKRFLWKVNTSTLYEHILNDMYHAAANLSQRIAQNREQQQEIANQPANDIQSKEYDRLKNTRIILETSLLRLDDTLMLFHDF